jgi:hypothetical protein
MAPFLAENPLSRGEMPAIMLYSRRLHKPIAAEATLTLGSPATLTEF